VIRRFLLACGLCVCMCVCVCVCVCARARAFARHRQESVSPFAELTPDNYNLYQTLGLPMVMLFVDPHADNTHAFGVFECVQCNACWVCWRSLPTLTTARPLRPPPRPLPTLHQPNLVPPVPQVGCLPRLRSCAPLFPLCL
jgi:hypothetical protein